MNLSQLLGPDLNAVVLALVLAVVVALVFEVVRSRFVFARRPRIVYYKTEEAFGVLNRQQVLTQTVVIQNLGSQQARNVQVIHNWPSSTGWKWNIQPPRKCSPITLPGRELAFEVEIIQPFETVFITYIYGTPPNQKPVLNSVIIAGHAARALPFPLASRYSRFGIGVFRALAFVGSWAVLYFLLQGAIAVWHRFA